MKYWIVFLVVIVSTLSYFLYRLIQARKEKKKDITLWATLSGITSAILVVIVFAMVTSPHSKVVNYSPIIPPPPPVMMENLPMNDIPVVDTFILSDGTPIRLQSTPISVPKQTDFEDIYLTPPNPITPPPPRTQKNPLFATWNKVKDSAMSFIEDIADDVY